MFMIVLPACVSVYIMYVWCSWSSEEGGGCPAAGVIGGCECWEMNLGLLPLTYLSSLCPITFFSVTTGGNFNVREYRGRSTKEFSDYPAGSN